MNLLETLKVFFRLKWEEMCEAWWNPGTLTHYMFNGFLLIVIGLLLFFITYVVTLAIEYTPWVVWVVLGGTWVVWFILYPFRKWIVSNWRKAKEIVRITSNRKPG